MEPNMRIVFMGHFTSILEELMLKTAIDLVIVENKKSASEVMEFCKKYALHYRVVDTFEDIKVIFSDVLHVELVVVASFGVILKEDLIKKCDYIVNIHPGDIPACRGRHPLPCAILNRHNFMALTAHLINNEKIDCGPIVAKIVIPINYKKSYKYNETRLLSASKDIISVFMDEYLSEKKITSCYLENAENGTYYAPLTPDTLNKIFAYDALENLV